jgi:hypothetical protein
MTAPSYIDEQREKTKRESPYHVQVEVLHVKCASISEIEQGNDIAEIEANIIHIFRSDSKADLKGKITIRISPCIPKDRVELMLTAPTVFCEDIKRAKYMEVYLNDAYEVPWSLAVTISGKTEEPTT